MGFVWNFLKKFRDQKVIFPFLEINLKLIKVHGPKYNYAKVWGQIAIMKSFGAKSVIFSKKKFGIQIIFLTLQNVNIIEVR